MNRFRNQRQNILQKIMLAANNRTAKFAVWVFVALITVGGLGSIGYNWLKSGQVESATVEQQVPTFGEIPGWWYMENFGSSVCESQDCESDSDPDKDKLSNYQEFVYGTMPNNPDTNSNGLTDGEDVAFGYAPNKPGKVKFEEVASDDSIVGESLAYNDEIKDLILDMTDISNLILPQVEESELNVLSDSSFDSFVKYMTDLDALTAKYNTSPDQFANLGDRIKQNDPAAISSTNQLAAIMVEEYKKIAVPADALELHKLQVALWGLVPQVINVPNTSNALDALYDGEINKWYDSAQAMISINQKIGIETAKLRNKYLGN
jgi:hypothetical protein